MRQGVTVAVRPAEHHAILSKAQIKAAAGWTPDDAQPQHMNTALRSPSFTPFASPVGEPDAALLGDPGAVGFVLAGTMPDELLLDLQPSCLDQGQEPSILPYRAPRPLRSVQAE